MENNPWRDPKGRYVSLAQRKLEKARLKLLEARQMAPVVYGDKGPFASLGVQRHERLIRSAELDVGLWEGRATDV
jgi:hypothetical protein